MGHSLSRFGFAITDALYVVLLFTFLGFMVTLAFDSWAPLLLVVLFASVFFAPAAFRKAWEDYGD